MKMSKEIINNVHENDVKRRRYYYFALFCFSVENKFFFSFLLFVGLFNFGGVSRPNTPLVTAVGTGIVDPDRLQDPPIDQMNADCLTGSVS